MLSQSQWIKALAFKSQEVWAVAAGQELKTSEGSFVRTYFVFSEYSCLGLSVSPFGVDGRP